MRLPESLLLAATITSLCAGIAFAKGPNKQSIDPADLGLRKAPLATIAPAGPKLKTRGEAPGSNRKLQKSYETAPPMVPHAIADYLPIGLRNQCLSCHTNPPKSYRTATHVPESHYTTRDGKTLDRTPKSVRKIYLGFYNCTMCHAAQKSAKALVKNTFEGD